MPMWRRSVVERHALTLRDVAYLALLLAAPRRASEVGRLLHVEGARVAARDAPRR